MNNNNNDIENFAKDLIPKGNVFTNISKSTTKLSLILGVISVILIMYLMFLNKNTILYNKTYYSYASVFCKFTLNLSTDFLVISNICLILYLVFKCKKQSISFKSLKIFILIVIIVLAMIGNRLLISVNYTQLFALVSDYGKSSPSIHHIPMIVCALILYLVVGVGGYINLNIFKKLNISK